MRFSDKLPKLRKNNNLSQEQLADKLGVSRQAVSKWESGSSYPDMDKIIQMCRILNCTLEDLLDDGAISGTTPKNKNNNFNNYFHEFLSFITKSYNMFCSMTFKEKIKFIFEMALLAGVLFIAAAIIAATLHTITANILGIFPYTIQHYLYSVIETIYITALLILGAIIVLHIFKIRYLDYFVTIEDSNVKEKTIEEPIEKKEDKNYVEKPKEKIIIRDPKHSTFSFIDLLAKLILYAVKFFSLFVLCPAVFSFVFCVMLAVFSLCHIQYGIIFFYITLGIIGCLSIIYMVIEFIYRFIFNIKERFKLLFILFITGLILIGMGIGLTISRVMSYEYKENSDDLKLTTQVEDVAVDQNTHIYFGTPKNNVDYIIDNSLDNAKLEITYLEGFHHQIEFNENLNEENESYKHYYVYLRGATPIKLYHLILNDLKNNTIRNYDASSFMKIKVYISEANYQMLEQNDAFIY